MASETIGVDLGIPRLDKARHVKYWTRCIKTFLPHQYTSNESNRMYLAFLMVCALDLLDALVTATSESERTDYVSWIYHCQHPDGGFRMWPGTDLGERADDSNAKWDPANVPATYFALAALLVLGDDFKQLKRKGTLQWLRNMQRSDGSFGETLVDGNVEGGRDPRFGYCAAGIRYVLRGAVNGLLTIDTDEIRDIDVDSLVRCIIASESYDGGIADQPFHEPHAGYTFCSLGALSYMNRLRTGENSNNVVTAPSNPEEVVRWLVSRQTDLLDADGTLDSEFIGSVSQKQHQSEYPERSKANDSQPLHQSPDKTLFTPGFGLGFETDCTGMNGRTNKVADTCYAWWAGASLHILGCSTLYGHDGIRRSLLERTQHPVLGGFGKFPGDLPDLYHSCLGLAALSLAGSTEVKELDAGMCISKEAKARLQKIWDAWEPGSVALDANTAY